MIGPGHTPHQAHKESPYDEQVEEIFGKIMLLGRLYEEPDSEEIDPNPLNPCDRINPKSRNDEPEPQVFEDQASPQGERDTNKDPKAELTKLLHV